MPSTTCPHCGHADIPYAPHETHLVFACVECGGLFSPRSGIARKVISQASDAPSSNAAEPVRVQAPPAPPRTPSRLLTVVVPIAAVCAVIPIVAAHVASISVPSSVPAPVRGGESVAVKVAAHRFWKVEVTEAMLRKVTDDLRGRPTNTFLFIDDQFRVAVVDDPARCQVIRSVTSYARPTQPSPLGNRFVYVDLVQFHARPAPEEVLKKLAAELDRTDFAAPREASAAEPAANERR